jgi:hypothetical protein
MKMNLFSSVSDSRAHGPDSGFIRTQVPKQKFGAHEKPNSELRHYSSRAHSNVQNLGKKIYEKGKKMNEEGMK